MFSLQSKEQDGAGQSREANSRPVPRRLLLVLFPSISCLESWFLVLEKAQKYTKSKTSEEPALHCVLSCARPPAIDKPPPYVCSVSVSASVRHAHTTWRAELRTFPLLLHMPKALFSISPKTKGSSEQKDMLWRKQIQCINEMTFCNQKWKKDN